MPAVSCLFLLCLVVSVGADQDVQVPQEELRLRSFVIAAYPELSGKPLQIEAIRRGLDVEVIVREVARDLTFPGRSIDTLLLTATATFSDAHRLRTFQARGPFLKDEDNRGLSEVVRRAQAAGDDVAAAIATRAPAFGPDRRAAMTDTLARLRLDSASSPIEITSLTPVSPPPDTRYGFVWEVLAKSRGADGIVRTHALTVEPFSGRLISAKEQD